MSEPEDIARIRRQYQDHAGSADIARLLDAYDAERAKREEAEAWDVRRWHAELKASGCTWLSHEDGWAIAEATTLERLNAVVGQHDALMAALRALLPKVEPRRSTPEYEHQRAFWTCYGCASNFPDEREQIAHEDGCLYVQGYAALRDAGKETT